MAHLWRNAFYAGLAAAVACFGCGVVPAIPLAVRQGLLLFALGEVIVLGVLGLVFWRCPHCRGSLPLNRLGLKTCPYCKKELK